MHTPRKSALALSGGIVLVLLALLAGLPLAASAQGPAPQAATAPLGTAFTYQGRLTDGAGPANGSYDFQFKLFDAASGGSQVGSTVTKSGVNVSGGLFTVELDFGSGAFDGNARWLEVAVKKPSDSSYTTLGRQKLTAAPFAISLLPGSQVRANLANPILSLVNTAPTAGGALYAQAQADAVPAINARHEGDAPAIQAVASGIDAAIFALHQGSQPAVEGRANGSQIAAILGINQATGGVGVKGEGGWTGVEGEGFYIGVEGTGDAYGGYFTATVGYGIYAKGSMGAAYFDGPVWVNGTLSWTPITGYVSIPAAAFVPADNFNSETLNLGALIRPNGSSPENVYAPVFLPHGATVTKMTAYWKDNDPNSNGTIRLYRSNFTTSPAPMAEVSTSGSSGDGSSSDGTISNPTVDNAQFTYYVNAYLPTDGTNYVGLYGVVIEYTVSKPH